MTIVRSEVRPGEYRDSIVLMQLRAALEELPGVDAAAAVMAAPENLGLLAASDLLPADADELRPEDLLVVVRARDRTVADAALGKVDELLRRRAPETADDYRSRSLATAVRLRPDARWVLISVPGRYAAGVAREALDLGLHVFLYSDNVAINDEAALKREAAARGLLVMGPDCGTAIVAGAGFGFANRVRQGPIGLVGASGTGLQAVACAIHAAGSGVSHALGTGARDLSAEVGAITALQALELLACDPATRAIVLVSKPPDPAVADRLLAAARDAGKPVVAYFQGREIETDDSGPLHFATSLGHAAALAVELAGGSAAPPGVGSGRPARTAGFSSAAGRRLQVAASGGRAPGSPRFLRGLFSGGTLALEALLATRGRLAPLFTNLSDLGEGATRLADPRRSDSHTILDLGTDELTAGRPHPMIDPTDRLRRLEQEASDPETGVILLDVVLGDGAHRDPASELAPAVRRARERGVEVVAVVIGVDGDPQNIETQINELAAAGAHVFGDPVEAVELAVELLGGSPAVDGTPAPARARVTPGGRGRPAVGSETSGAATEARSVDPRALDGPVVAINVGVEVFYRALVEQGVEALHVDWRPPAGGDERLMAILDRLKPGRD